MKTKTIIKYTFAISLILVVYTSCFTERKVIKEPIKEDGVDYIFSKLKENELKYNDLSLRFDAELILDKNKNSFKGSIKIRKDSAIWISISPLLP